MENKNIFNPENINENNLFLTKYQPQLLEHFNINSSVIDTLYELVKLNNLNILFIGDSFLIKTV